MALRRARHIAVAGLAGLLAIPALWVGSDRVEQNNDFCTACHLDSVTPLHIDIRRDFDRGPAMSLAAAHRSTGGDGHPFRCIECHGGTSLSGRARVKALAAVDAISYFAGHFEEPAKMRWPLGDENCTKCHGVFAEAARKPWETPHFHDLEIHNVDSGIACVACHRSHTGGGDDSSAHFLHAPSVRMQCARCHPEFGAGGTAPPIS